MGVGAYRYGFNGKERDDEGEWGSSTVYDYGFRVYDPAIAKFLSVDPLSPDYPELTPYQFASLNPIKFIDLDGLEAADPVTGRRGPWSLSYIHRDLSEADRDEITRRLGADHETFVADLNKRHQTEMLGLFAETSAVLFDVIGMGESGSSILDDLLRGSRSFKTTTKAALEVTNSKFTFGAGKRIVEFFGGARGFIPSAINVDVVAVHGFKGTIADFAKQATKRGLNGTIDRVVASGPQAPFLDEAAQLLKPGGELIINATKGNKFGKIPAAKLQELGFEVVQKAGKLLDEFGEQVFRRSDKTVIPTESVKTTILRKL